MGAHRLVQALAVAWSTAQLYPDPTSVPAFAAAVESLGEPAVTGLELDVTLDGFMHRGEPVDVKHGAAERLARALFSHNVESIALVGRPTPEEVARLFQEVESEDTTLSADFKERLELAGVQAFRLRLHRLLEDAEAVPEDQGEERSEAVEELFNALAPEESVVEQLEVIDGSGPRAEAFVDFYGEAIGSLEAGDWLGKEKVVQAYVDAFVRLERDAQVQILETTLQHRHEKHFENFLDQFAAQELALLAPHLHDSALLLLLDYARVVSEEKGEEANLETLLTAEADLSGARNAVAARVGERMAEMRRLGSESENRRERLAPDIPPTGNAAGGEGVRVLNELLLIESRSARTLRLLRLWAGKVASAVRAGDMVTAVEWSHAIAEQGRLDPKLVDEAFGYLAADDILEILVSDTGDAGARTELLEVIGRRAGLNVLELMAREEDPGRRRVLIDVLAEIARLEIGVVLPGLADHRWYVVRNLALALGKSGRRAAAEPLSRLARHEDHRVRIEALRGLMPCLGPDASPHLLAALADDHVRVRSTAIDLLASLEDAAVLPQLGDMARDDSLSAEQRTAVIEAVASRPSAAATGLLSELASSKAGLSGAARSMRAAAREALRSRDG